MSLIDINKAKTITGIEDETVLQFYIDAVIAKIEIMIGYSLSETTQDDYICGVNTKHLWLIRKPVSSVNSVKINGETVEVEEYELRNGKTPYLNFLNNIIYEFMEVVVNSTAGYTSYDGANPIPLNLEMFIYNSIKVHMSSLDSSGIESYKIDTISYKFRDYMNNNKQFINEINNIFGLLQ